MNPTHIQIALQESAQTMLMLQGRITELAIANIGLQAEVLALKATIEELQKPKEST